MKQEFKIEGMSCGHCVSAVRSALDQIDDLNVVDVTLGGATVEFGTGVAAEADAESLIAVATRAIEEEGYSVVASKTLAAVGGS